MLKTILEFGKGLIRIFDYFKPTKQQKRRKSLSKLDKATSEAKNGRLEDLAKWIGRKL